MIYLDRMMISRPQLMARRKAPWRPVEGCEPAFEAARDQYCAETNADLDGYPRSEWSPAKERK